jgi:hypothetical protein
VLSDGQQTRDEVKAGFSRLETMLASQKTAADDDKASGTDEETSQRAEKASIAADVGLSLLNSVATGSTAIPPELAVRVGDVFRLSGAIDPTSEQLCATVTNVATSPPIHTSDKVAKATQISRELKQIGYAPRVTVTKRDGSVVYDSGLGEGDEDAAAPDSRQCGSMCNGYRPTPDRRVVSPPTARTVAKIQFLH